MNVDQYRTLAASPSQIAGFKAYDYRARIPTELNSAIAYRIGRAYAEFLKPRRVVVGRDIRLSRAVDFEALDEDRLREVSGEDMAQAIGSVHGRLNVSG